MSALCGGPATRASLSLIFAAGALVFGVGCWSSGPGEASESPAMAASSTTADADRAALTRFIGVWNFTGWAEAPGSTRSEASGVAAGVIEDEYFILLDLQATAGQFGGRTGRKVGSMLFASEAGIGPTLTAWGDASPAVTRLVGRAESDGSRFTFEEMKTPAGTPRHSLTIMFETNDRWVAEIRSLAAGDHRLVARYQFTRGG